LFLCPRYLLTRAAIIIATYICPVMLVNIDNDLAAGVKGTTSP